MAVYYFSYAAVFNNPKIIGSSDGKICTTINDSVSLHCLFNTATMEGATIVVWLKDNSNISGYENETRPVEGEDNKLISILQIRSVTHEALGTYTCYCYYNKSMVTSDKPVTSDRATMYIDTDCHGGKNTGQLQMCIT